MTSSPLNVWLALRCRDPIFWCYLGVDSEQEAIHQVRTRCGVGSRREFDSNDAAARRCHRLIRHPFIEFVHAHEETI